MALPATLSPLLVIKLLHTAVWVFFVLCIVALPITAALRRFRWSLVLAIVVGIECVVVALNHFYCPLTSFAERYTTDRAANFDIYLPVWLAENNQRIFGTLFILGGLFALWRWFVFRREARMRVDSKPC